MKFLLDVNMPTSLGQLLRDAGRTVRCVPDIMPETSPDSSICEMALLHEETIVTHDTDFGTLIVFSGAGGPSVILFRIHHINAVIFADLILTNWVSIEESLLDGALVAFETDKVRIRSLPIIRR